MGTWSHADLGLCCASVVPEGAPTIEAAHIGKLFHEWPLRNIKADHAALQSTAGAFALQWAFLLR